MAVAGQAARLLPLVALVAVLPAQEFRADMQGIVTDPSALPVLGARVRIVNTATGLEAATTSNETGEYRFLRLAPGRYRMEVSTAGFKTWVREPIVLEVAARVRLDVALEVGELQQQVLVTAPAPMVERVEAAISQVVRQREITDLPLNGRNSYALLALSADIQPANPGIFGELGPREIGGRSNFSVSGAPQRTAEVLMDGVPSTVGKLVAISPNPDVVREFKVQNSFDAEYGYLLGGVVNAVTRSGTNVLHGTLWEFLRNDRLQANGFFSNKLGQAKPAFRYNQFGVAAGGPILRNRAFFFGSWEGSRERNPARYLETVPTARERQGDFSETLAANGRLIQVYDPFSSRASGAGFMRDAFAGNRIPASRMDSAGKSLVGYFPLPNQPGQPVTGALNFTDSGADKDTYDAYQGRVDYDLTPRQKVFARYSLVKAFNRPHNPLGNEAMPFWVVDMHNQSLSADYTRVHSPSTLFNLRGGFTRHFNDGGPERGFDASRLNFARAFVRQLRAAYFPRVDVSDASQLGPPSGGQLIADNSYSLHANASRLQGRHNFKAGGDFRFSQGNQFLWGHSGGWFTLGRGFTQGPDPLRASANAGHGVASLLLGTGSGRTDIQEPMSTGIVASAFYFNDTWTVNPRLSLTLGLRYENYGPLTERYDRFNRGFAWDVASPIEAAAQANYAQARIPELAGLSVKGGVLFAGVGGEPRGLTDRDNNNIAPRFGLAYSFTPATVFRGGYGISYSQLDSIIPRNVITAERNGFTEQADMVGSIDGITPHNLLHDPYPEGLVEPAGASKGLMTGIGTAITVFSVAPRTAYSQNYQGGLQRQLGPDCLLEAAYIGSLVQQIQVNHAVNSYAPRFLALGARLNARVANPFFGLIPGGGALSTATTTVGQLLQPYPHYPSIAYRESIGRSWYHSMRMKLEKRFSKGWSVLASYRVSKLMERTGFLNATDAAGERVISGGDSPQRFVLSGLWEPLSGDTRGRRALGKLAAGWQLNWIFTANSGFPTGAPGNADSIGRSARLAQPAVDRWFDTSAFTIQAPYTLRTLSSRLPDVRNDGILNFDLSVLKNTRVSERFMLQFRAESFNAFNHPLFAGPNTNIRAATFGQVSSQSNGPREIQFGLKLIF